MEGCPLTAEQLAGVAQLSAMLTQGLPLPFLPAPPPMSLGGIDYAPQVDDEYDPSQPSIEGYKPKQHFPYRHPHPIVPPTIPSIIIQDPHDLRPGQKRMVYLTVNERDRPWVVKRVAVQGEEYVFQRLLDMERHGEISAILDIEYNPAKEVLRMDPTIDRPDWDNRLDLPA